jgi:hypothetical protein
VSGLIDGLTAQNLAQLQQWGGNTPTYVRDTRPARVRLSERLQRNEDTITTLTAANDELRAAIAELDAHPAIEKISDLLRKLLP